MIVSPKLKQIVQLAREGKKITYNLQGDDVLVKIDGIGLLRMDHVVWLRKHKILVRTPTSDVRYGCFVYNPYHNYKGGEI